MGLSLPRDFGSYPKPRHSLDSREEQLRLAFLELDRGLFIEVSREFRESAGTYTAMWNGADSRGRRVSAGVYLVKLTSDGFAVTHKLVVQRQVRITV